MRNLDVSVDSHGLKMHASLDRDELQIYEAAEKVASTERDENDRAGRELARANRERAQRY